MKPLSFIIITYNRPDDALALLQNIVQLTNAAELLEEVIVVNNASSDSYKAVTDFIDQQSIPFKYFFSEENLGVARGRNMAIQKSSAPILIMLDDDAELQNKDALINLVAEFEQQNIRRPKAIVSFKVLYFDNLQMQKNALPHKHFDEFKNQAFFETYFYAGGAHAIKKEVINRVGLYPTDFFYGMEEYDMSYRILDAGYSITYSNKIVMLHKESPQGRKPKKEKLRMMWVNKAKVAWRYLPKKYFYSTAFMWSVQYLKETGFNLDGFFKGWKEITAIRSVEKRTPVSNETLAYLKSLKARLWY